MKLLNKVRQQKVLSVTVMLFTLSIGIVIGTLVNSGVNAARGQGAAPDATATRPKRGYIGVPRISLGRGVGSKPRLRKRAARRSATG